WDWDPVLDVSMPVPAEYMDGRALRRLTESFQGCELGRLRGRDRATVPVTNEDLYDRGESRNRERNRECRPLVTAPVALQPPKGVGPGKHEAGHHVAGDVHVHQFVQEVPVAEERAHRMHVDDVAAAGKTKAGGMVHPPVDRDHRQRAGETGDRDRDAAREMRARRETVPAVDVDPDEDRLHEEGEALDREAKPEHASEGPGETGPEETHLEAENRAGDDAGR